MDVKNYTDQDYAEVESEERELTDEQIAVMLLLLKTTKESLELEFRDFYARYGRDGVVTYNEARKWVSEKDHKRRLTALVLFVHGAFSSLNTRLTPEFRQMLLSVIDVEEQFFHIDIEESITTTIVEAQWGSDHRDWQDRLDHDLTVWMAYILTDLKRNLVKKGTIDDLLILVEKRFKYFESMLTTLGLSESTAVGSLIRKKIFENLGIKKYRFFTKADERTCEICSPMHGLVFPISAYEVGVTASPLHPRCRCWEVPIFD